MREINEPIWTYVRNKKTRSKCSDVSTGEGSHVDTYTRLVRRVAILARINNGFSFFYRGQGEDYGRIGKRPTSLLPSMLRGCTSVNELKRRYDLLVKKDNELREMSLFSTFKDVKQNRLLRWAIIQHYERCTTPLLDVTSSLHVACSFAQIAARKEHKKMAYVYVLGFPHIAGPIAVSADQNILLIRLHGVCPGTAFRPHFQDAYLAGEFPELTDHATMGYATSYEEYDFSRRLVAKFTIPIGERFWGDDFQQYGESVLYPQNDKVKKALKKLR